MYLHHLICFETCATQQHLPFNIFQGAKTDGCSDENTIEKNDIKNKQLLQQQQV